MNFGLLSIFSEIETNTYKQNSAFVLKNPGFPLQAPVMCSHYCSNENFYNANAENKNMNQCTAFQCNDHELPKFILSL